MKTKNDQGDIIYICPCCHRTWLNSTTYKHHLQDQIETLTQAIAEAT
jgi:uracil-DNA glycosylase